MWIHRNMELLVPAVACTLLFGSSYSSFTRSMGSSGTSWVFSACQMASWEHGQMPFQGRERQHAGAFCSLDASQTGASWSELRQLSHSSLLWGVQCCEFAYPGFIQKSKRAIESRAIELAGIWRIQPGWCSSSRFKWSCWPASRQASSSLREEFFNLVEEMC